LQVLQAFGGCARDVDRRYSSRIRTAASLASVATAVASEQLYLSHQNSCSDISLEQLHQSHQKSYISRIRRATALASEQRLNKNDLIIERFAIIPDALMLLLLASQVMSSKLPQNKNADCISSNRLVFGW
jgi:hypothetical protein